MSETARPRFTPVPEAPPPNDAAAKAGMRMIMAGLAALSQRAAAGVSDLFSLILVAVVTYLAYAILDNPTQLKIITVFGVAFFCVVIDTIRRRAK